MTRLPALVFGLGLIFAGATHASDDAVALDVQSRAFSEQARQIQEELASGTEYSEIRPADRSTVLELLGRMEARIGPATSVDELTDHVKVELFNDQERINAILTGARQDSRLICTRTQITGSHRRQNVCITAAERDRRREMDQSGLREHQHKTPPPPNM